MNDSALQARVLAVSRSAVHGFSKQPRTNVRLLAGEGVEGDAHCGLTVQHLYHKRCDPAAPNRSQVHLFAAEMLEELHAKGFAIAPGELGENLLTEGVDLLALPEGARLHLGADAVVEITGLRTPCLKLDRFRAGLQQHLWGERLGGHRRQRRAGVMAIVAAGGAVEAGDAIRVELPSLPYRALRPV